MTGFLVEACTPATIEIAELEARATLNEIQAQSGKDITVAQANDLIADVNRIKAVIGCA